MRADDPACDVRDARSVANASHAFCAVYCVAVRSLASHPLRILSRIRLNPASLSLVRDELWPWRCSGRYVSY